MDKKKSVWLDPEYHKVLKIKATEEGVSLLEYTRKLAEEYKENRFKNEKKRFEIKW